MVQDEENNVIRSVKQSKVGESLFISLSDGAVLATVTEIKENTL